MDSLQNILLIFSFLLSFVPCCQIISKNKNISCTQSVYDQSQSYKQSWQDIINCNERAVVLVILHSAKFNWIEPYKTPQQTLSVGTGFFINDQGYIITNAHCIDQAAVIYIQVPYIGKQHFEAKIVAMSHDRDIALIRLTKAAYTDLMLLQNDETIHYLTFGNSDNVSRGEEISTLGFPLGQEFLKSTTGSVSGIQSLSGRNFIQIDAPINPGNSGGPAFDISGKVIGINSCGIFKDGAQNVGYIIPAKEVQIFLKQVKSSNLIIPQSDLVNTYDTKPLLVRDPLMALKYHGSPEAVVKFCNNPFPGGPYITEVAKKSLADSMGFCVGDMIYSINDYHVDRYGDINVPWSRDKISIGQLLYQLDIGTLLSIIIYRNGVKHELHGIWQLEELLPIRYMIPPFETIEYIVIAGMVIMPLTVNHITIFEKTPYFDNLAKYAYLKNHNKPKLIVTHILPNSLAEKARYIHPGMIIKKINDQKVGTIEECNNAILANKNTEYMTMLFTTSEFFVAQLSQMLQQEQWLSEFYHYPVSAVVQELLNQQCYNMLPLSLPLPTFNFFPAIPLK